MLNLSKIHCTLRLIEITSKKVEVSLLEECSKTRIGHRIPALTYYYNANASGLWRTAKTKIGF